ncbi:hypothetical protein DFH27DRAFT_615882 [Peziza echinospora]|nr:hypothetical protein DFH27DRAFT_615882 [Peziza echinospora]
MSGNSTTSTHQVGYDDDEAMAREDARVKEIIIADTGIDVIAGNFATPPIFFYFGFTLTEAAVEKLRSIPGVWVKP